MVYYRFLRTIMSVFISYAMCIMTKRTRYIINVNMVFIMRFGVNFRVIRHGLIYNYNLFRRGGSYFAFSDLVGMAIPILLYNVDECRVLDSIVHSYDVVFFLNSVSLTRRPRGRDVFSIGNYDRVFFSFSMLNRENVDV